MKPGRRTIARRPRWSPPTTPPSRAGPRLEALAGTRALFSPAHGGARHRPGPALASRCRSRARRRPPKGLIETSSTSQAATRTARSTRQHPRTQSDPTTAAHAIAGTFSRAGRIRPPGSPVAGAQNARTCSRARTARPSTISSTTSTSHGTVNDRRARPGRVRVAPGPAEPTEEADRPVPQLELGRAAEGEAVRLGRVDELEPGQALEDGPDRDRPLQAGHVEAEAVVDAEAEREVVAAVVAADVEAERVLEDLGVAVGRERRDADELAAAELDVRRSPSAPASSAR